MALTINGQLTTNGGIPFKDTINYAYLFPERNRDKSIDILVRIYRNRQAFLDQDPWIHHVSEVDKRYKITTVMIDTLPIANVGINAMPGKNVDDKFEYWINNQVMNMILADNPTFTITIRDVNI